MFDRPPVARGHRPTSNIAIGHYNHPRYRVISTMQVYITSTEYIVFSFFKIGVTDRSAFREIHIIIILFFRLPSGVRRLRFMTYKERHRRFEF